MTKAPKERINVTYKAKTGGKLEERELPFNILSIGDFGTAHRDKELGQRPTTRVNKKNLDQVIESQGVKVRFDVEDVVSGEDGSMMSVDLDIKKMGTFKPDEVARQIPQLARLLALREELSQLSAWFGQKGLRDAIAKKLSDPTVKQVLDDAGGLSALLGQDVERSE